MEVKYFIISVYLVVYIPYSNSAAALNVIKGNIAAVTDKWLMVCRVECFNNLLRLIVLMAAKEC